MTCPSCGGTHVDRDEVDIGVGTQVGPWGCFDCGWVDGREDTCPDCGGGLRGSFPVCIDCAVVRALKAGE